MRERGNRSDIFVINAANNGHNSLQIPFRFYLKALPLKPAHVIFYENINDIAFEELKPESVKITGDILFSKSMGEYVAKVNRGSTFYRKTLLSHLIASLLIPQKLQEYLDVDSQGKKFRDEVTPKQAEIQKLNGQRFISNIRTLSQICKAHGVKLILTTFAFDEGKTKLYARANMEYRNQLLRDLAKGEGLPLVDIEKSFQGVSDKAPYFSEEDHYHPTRKGAEFISEVLREALAAQL